MKDEADKGLTKELPDVLVNACVFMNSRQWIVAGIGVLIAALMYTFPSLRHPLGVTSLGWHRVAGWIVLLIPVLLLALKSPRVSVETTEGEEDPCGMDTLTWGCGALGSSVSVSRTSQRVCMPAQCAASSSSRISDRNRISPARTPISEAMIS